jgi:hypothetical protein
MRVNGWQRIGIIASIIWALGAGIYTHNADVERAQGFAKYAYKVCSDGKSLKHDSDLSSCERERQANLATWMVGDAGNVAFAALVPIPLGWIAAYILVYVGRAQVVGFRAVIPWATLPWYKKAFVTVAALAGLIAILFGVTAILNLYVDTQVPVGLIAHNIVTKGSEDLVIAEGTWTRSGLTEESSLAYPLQTSHIVCSRPEHTCTEARASVSGNLLMADLVEYEIESWSDAAIVFTNDSPCAVEVFTIDLNTEAVTGAGHPVNEDSPLCRMSPQQEKHWNYRLADGFKVYWELRQKARPLPLRLIQTLFGN